MSAERLEALIAERERAMAEFIADAARARGLRRRAEAATREADALAGPLRERGILLARSGIPQSQIAEAMGVSRAAVNQWISGARRAGSNDPGAPAPADETEVTR